MSELPDPPARTDNVTFTRPVRKRTHPVVGVLLGALLGFFPGFLAGQWTAEAPTAPATPAAKPAATAVPVITQEVLDAKVERAAFYTGRGQPDGGSRILQDMLKGTGCEVLSARWGATDTKTEAEQASEAFLNAQPKGALASVAIVKSENPDLAGGKFVGTAVSLNCPKDEV
jgi:hypothetical protein